MLRKAGDARGHKPVAVAFACVYAFEFLPVFAEKFVVVVIVVVIIVLVVEVVVVVVLLLLLLLLLVLVLVLVLFVLLVLVLVVVVLLLLLLVLVLVLVLFVLLVLLVLLVLVLVVVVVVLLLLLLVLILVLVLLLVLFVLLVVVFLNSRMVQARALVLFSSTVILICYRNTFASFKAIPAESWRFLFRFRPGKHSNVSTKRRLRADASSSSLQEFWSENYHVRSWWIASVFFPWRSIRTLASFQEKKWWKFIQPFANGQTSRRVSENMQKLRKNMAWNDVPAQLATLNWHNRGAGGDNTFCGVNL